MPTETRHSKWKADLQDAYLRGVCGFANVECVRLFFGKDDEGKMKFIRKAVDL